MIQITNIHAREILDSRGNPTVEATLTCSNNIQVTSSVPSGASTGSKEALELRDKDATRYHGKGVLTAVENINTTIKKAIVGQELNQVAIDKCLLKLDGTANKSHLGANAMLAVSLCIIKALAKSENKELYAYLSSGKATLPIPLVNIINGGMHADNNLEIQEFMIVPVVKTFKERVRVASEVFHTLKTLLKEAGLETSVGDEGGFAPNLECNTKALDFIVKAIEKSGYIPGKDVFISLDCAASSFYDSQKNTYQIDQKEFTPDELIRYYERIVKEYPILSIEDPFDEKDLASFTKLTALLGQKIMLIGDDYFVTNETYLEQGISAKAGNAILLKANQIGTVTEMTKTILLAKKKNYKTIISHRSGETLDTFIADFAVGLNLPFIKTGSMSRGERIAKYNRLMEIEEQLTTQS